MFKCNKVLYDANLVEVLKKRNLILQSTKKVITDKSNLTLYTGADPTAKSLHLGNLVPLLLSLHLNLNNNNLILLSGGATGVLGDPTFKVSEREKKDLNQLEQNRQAIANQQERFFQNAIKYYNELKAENSVYGIKTAKDIGNRKYVNNLDWFGNVNLLQFLHEYGSNFKIKELLSKDSVKQRLNHNTSNGGMDGSLSIKEFFYQVLQGYDFYHLYKTEHCLGQIGGNDQWGNMTSGLEFMRRQADVKNDDYKFILSTPLLIDSAGKKFGKSEGNALFLNPKMTSIFEIYQYFINVMDEDIERFLKIFTLLSNENIAQIMGTINQDRSKKIGHKILAENVVHLIHGKEYLPLCEELSHLLFKQKVLLQYLIDHKEEADIFDKFKAIYNFKKLSKNDNSDMHDIIKMLEPSMAERSIHTCLTGGFKYFSKDGDFKSFKYVKEESSLTEILDKCQKINDKFVIFKLGKHSIKIIEII